MTTGLLVTTTILFTACNHTTNVKETPKEIVFVEFENDNDLYHWRTNSVYGHTEIDQNVKYTGNSSLHLSPDSGCYEADWNGGITIGRGMRYSVKFDVIVSAKKSDATNSCADDCVFEVKTFGSAILHESIKTTTNWEKKTFYFEPEEDLFVLMKFKVGVDVWIDNLSFVYLGN
jgi:hypothetical protein